MIKASHHTIVYPFFKWLTRVLIKTNFHTVVMEEDIPTIQKSVLIVANHSSWWDGFWMEYLNQKVIHRKLHFMMLETQLKKHWYFRHTGGFSIKPESKEVIDSLNYAMELLKDNQNMVIIFPQGRIHSAHQDNIRFGKGVQFLKDNCPVEFQVLFTACFTDYFSHFKPSLYIYCQSISSHLLKDKDLELEYQFFYSRSRNKHNIKTS